MLKIQECKYIDNYRLNVLFDNGSFGVANLQDEVISEPYTVLQDKNIFRSFYLDHGAICWLDGTIDMAIEYLFYLANKHKPSYQKLFQEWGYKQL